MAIHTQSGISYLTSDTFTNFGVTHGFFMRHGGCSPSPWNSLNMATSVGDTRENVINNRKRLSTILGIEHEQFYDVWQVHGNEVLLTDKPRLLEQKHLQADAITTNKKNVFLLMLFADCVPILLFDKETSAVGIAHAGWKGTLNNVLGELVRIMGSKYKSFPQDLTAVIGPSICLDHYQVGDEIAERSRKIFSSDRVLKQQGNKNFLNLALANEVNLIKCGVVKIERMEICTLCSNGDWFSHRGEKGKTGRFAAVIGLNI